MPVIVCGIKPATVLGVYRIALYWWPSCLQGCSVEMWNLITSTQFYDKIVDSCLIVHVKQNGRYKASIW